MQNWKYNEDKTRILVDKPPTRKLKVTGTRFATILGFNDWQGSFTAWCEITKLGKLPFTESIYTNAGKVIEPKVHAYLKEKMGLKNLKTPDEYFGERRKEVAYDFFPDQPIFGGMWDAVVTKNDGITPRICVEYKTTKRAEDWEFGPPLYYLAQACLYPYLMGINDFILTVTFLKDNDYNNPQNFVVSDDNTRIYTFKVDEVRFPLNGEVYTFGELIAEAKEWWEYYIKGTESPVFDEKKDKDMLALLRKTKPANDSDVHGVIEHYNQLANDTEYLNAKALVETVESQLKALKEGLKVLLVEEIEKNPTLEVVEADGWVLSKSAPRYTADVKALLRDNMVQYLTLSEPSYTLRSKKE